MRFDFITSILIEFIINIYILRFIFRYSANIYNKYENLLRIVDDL